jgi:2-methylcitrate dehydratase PrpD
MFKKSSTSKLADFVERLSYEDLPPEVITSAKKCILDSLGCALGGSQTEEIAPLAGGLLKLGSEQGATVWGFPDRTELFKAALLNGLMCHALEMDDVHREAKAHAGAVVVPAAVTLGEAQSISGKELITAVISGYEIMLRIGVGIGAQSHRLRGWHATSTCGTFGAAAAAGRILGLNAQQLCWALGLAGTQSSGLWAFTADGATCKKLHAGRAAQSGILAAVLAQAGMSGPSQILEAKDGGLFPATSDAFSLEAVTAGLGERYLINEVSVKPYACCRSMHPAIDAALTLRRRYYLDPSRIKRIVAATYGVAVQQCGFTARPQNTAEAQFSLPYGVAVALVDGNALMDQFAAERIYDQVLVDLAAKVELVIDPEFHSLYPKKWGCRLKIEMTDDEVLVEEVLAAKGDPENPLTAQELKDKFLALAQGAIGIAKSQAAAEMIDHLDQLENILPLTNLLKGLSRG